MRLLIVEDNEELAELLAKGLRTAGYEADMLSTIEDARAVLSTTFYAALILDLGLPDGDGLALLRDWRRSCGGPASCSATRCASPTSSSTPRTGRPRSTISRRCYRRVRPRCS